MPLSVFYSTSVVVGWVGPVSPLRSQQAAGAASLLQQPCMLANSALGGWQQQQLPQRSAALCFGGRQQCLLAKAVLPEPTG